MKANNAQNDAKPSDACTKCTKPRGVPTEIGYAKPSNARKLKMVMSATTKISYEYADAAQVMDVRETH